jgi:hypothetical protein
MVRTARDEARRIVEGVQAEVSARAAALDKELAESEKALPVQIQAKLDDGAEEIQKRARIDLARYVGVSEARVAALARYVVDRLVEAPTP